MDYYDIKPTDKINVFTNILTGREFNMQIQWNNTFVRITPETGNTCTVTTDLMKHPT